MKSLKCCQLKEHEVQLTEKYALVLNNLRSLIVFPKYSHDVYPSHTVPLTYAVICL